MALLIYTVSRATGEPSSDLYTGTLEEAKQLALARVESGECTIAAVFRDVIGFSATGKVQVKVHPGTAGESA